MDHVYSKAFFLRYELILQRKLLLNENAFCISDVLNFQAATETEVPEPSIALAFLYSYLYCPIVVCIRPVYLK